MASLNFECIICSKNCKISDEIVSTQCGHIFHKNCLKKKHEGIWFSSLRLPQCPQCLAEIKNTTKLLFKFETGPSIKDIEITELKSQQSQLQQKYEANGRRLKIVESEILTRSKEVFDLKTHNNYLTHQFENTKKEIANKNNEIQSLKNESYRKQQKIELNETKFVNLQKDFTKKSEECNLLSKKYEHVSMLNKEFSKEIAAKRNEIQILKEDIQKTHSQVSSAAFETQIDVLKERIKHISMELTKEIRNSSQLEAENLRLLNLIEQKKLKTQQDDNDDKVEETKFQNSEVAKKNEAPVDGKANDPQMEVNSMPSVVIRNVKEKFADKAAMRKFVYKLFDLMGLFTTADDCLDVSHWIDGKFNKNTLLISLKNCVLKNLVLQNSHKLKLTSEMQALTVHDYDKDNNSLVTLFQDAKILKSAGYKKVYMRNNIILVRKCQESEPIRIKSRADIEKLITDNENTIANK